MLAAAVSRLTSLAPGIRFKSAWLAEQAAHVAAASSAEGASDVLLRLFVSTDLRDSSDGSLPQGLDRQHGILVEGAHIVQILQIVDISRPREDDAVVGEGGDGEQQSGTGDLASATEQRQQNQQVRSPGMLKVCLTDGAQALVGIERRPIAALREAHPGAKALLANRPQLRRGLLILEPCHLELLLPGGSSLASGRREGRSIDARPPPPLLPPSAAAVTSVSPLPLFAELALPCSAPRIEHRGGACGVSPDLGRAAAVSAVATTTLAPAAAAAAAVEATPLPDRGARSDGGGDRPSRRGGLGHCYVREARLATHGLQMCLCDGKGTCEVLMPWPLLRKLLGDVPRESLPHRALLLQGFFELGGGGSSASGGESLPVVRACAASPSRGHVERLLGRLNAPATRP